MKCPKNKENEKLYIIPTKKWLKPLEPLIIDDINTSGLIMIAENIEKEKVIVKITKDKRDDIVEINNIIKDMPNFINTYCSFSCLENFDALDTQYEGADGFCNSKDGSGDFITLEIMKKYKNGSLNKYINKLELDQVINIIKQLLLAQIHIFNKTGFLHNDIHLGNILIEKSKNEIELKYKINTSYFIDVKRIFIIKTNFIPIISDFNNSIIYSDKSPPKIYSDKSPPKIYSDKSPPKIYYDNKYTLGENIYKTFNECLLLLKDKSIRYLIKQKLEDNRHDINKYIFSSEKNLRSYYKKYHDYKYFIIEGTNNMIAFSGLLLRLLNENSTDDWYN